MASPTPTQQRLQNELTRFQRLSAQNKQQDIKVLEYSATFDDWRVHFGTFPSASPLKADLDKLKAHGFEGVLVCFRFSAKYPTEVPFVRIVKPALKFADASSSEVFDNEKQVVSAKFLASKWKSTNDASRIIDIIQNLLASTQPRVDFEKLGIEDGDSKRTAPPVNETVEQGFDNKSSPLFSKDVQEARKLALQIREEEKVMQEIERQRQEEERARKKAELRDKNEIRPSLLQKDPTFSHELLEKEKRKEEQFEEIRRAQQEKMNLLKKKPSQIVAIKHFPENLKQQSFAGDVPAEIHDVIFALFDWGDLFTLQLVCKYWYSRVWSKRKSLDFRKKKPSERHLRYILSKLDPSAVVSVFIPKDFDAFANSMAYLPRFFGKIPNLKAISWELIQPSHFALIKKYTQLTELSVTFRRSESNPQAVDQWGNPLAPPDDQDDDDNDNDQDNDNDNNDDQDDQDGQDDDNNGHNGNIGGAPNPNPLAPPGFFGQLPQPSQRKTRTVVGIPGFAEALEGMTKLTKFTAYSCSLRDWGFLSKLYNLTHLNLSYARVTGKLLSEIGKLPNLARLNLQKTMGLKAEFFETLPRRMPLRHLNINTCKELKRFNFLEKFPDLETLNASSCHRSIIDCLIFLPKLLELQVNDVELRESDIEHISNVVTLKSLSLRGCRALNDATLAYLGTLPNLEDLGIGSTLVSNLRPIADLPNLRTLNIAHCRLIPLAGTQVLASKKNLTILTVVTKF